MKLSKFVMAFLVFSLMAGMALAQPRQGRGQGGQGGGLMIVLSEDSPLKRLSDAIGKLDLTSDQKDKIDALKKEYDPKFKEVMDKAGKILTDDQKKLVPDGRKKMQDATGADRRTAMTEFRDSLKLTDDQKKQIADVSKESGDLMQEARPKFMDVLTDAQKEKLRAAMPGRGGGRGRGNNNNPPQSST